MNGGNERLRFWRRHWSDWASSGLSQRTYCEHHGLSYATFVYGRNRVKEGLTEFPGSSFVPVLIETPMSSVPDGVDPASVITRSIAGVDIRLKHGRTVVVLEGFDETLLARVMRLLEQLPC